MTTSHSENAAKVFVAQAINVDYGPAETEFGTIKILSDQEIWPYGYTDSNVRTAHGIEKAIALEYRPGVDYLLPTGSVLAMAHMFSAAFAKGTVHQILKWDARAQRYYSYRLVTLEGKQRGER